METYTLVSLSAFIGIIFHVATCEISALVTRRHKSAVNGTNAEKESIIKGNANGYARIFIPKVLTRWPWPRRINPHYAEVKKESADWVASFNSLSPKAQYAFDRCNFSLLGCMCYPTAKKEHARASCDAINLLFLIDELTDVANPSEVRKQKDIIMDAFYNPHKPRPNGEWICGEIVRQFWEFTIQNASKQSQKRFIKTFEEYLEAVVQEAIDRTGRHIRDIKSYIEIRRDTSATKPVFALLEQALDIPDEVMSHPAVQEMCFASMDMISLENDIISYNLEQSRGHDHYNIVTIVMNELDTDVNGAMLWVQDLHIQLEDKFLTAMATLPQWEEPLNSQVREYCNGLAQWVRGNYDWSFEGERYLGDKGPEIKEKRWISLLPKRKNAASEIGPVLVQSSLL